MDVDNGKWAAFAIDAFDHVCSHGSSFHDDALFPASAEFGIGHGGDLGTDVDEVAGEVGREGGVGARIVGVGVLLASVIVVVMGNLLGAVLSVAEDGEVIRK